MPSSSLLALAAHNRASSIQSQLANVALFQRSRLLFRTTYCLESANCLQLRLNCLLLHLSCLASQRQLQFATDACFLLGPPLASLHTGVFSRTATTVSRDSATAWPPIDPKSLPFAQKNFAPHCQQNLLVRPFFKFPQTPKKGAVMTKTEISALQRAISTRSRARRNPRVLAFDPYGGFRHFHVFRDHVTNFGKPIIQKTKISFRSNITQNVYLSEINSSDTGNLPKSNIPDSLHFLQTQVSALKLLSHL